MGHISQTAKIELVDRTAALIRERLEEGRAGMAEEFLRQYTLNAPPADLANTEPEELYGAVLSLLGFLRKRTPGVPKIRAINPRVDTHGWQGDHTVVEIINDDMPFLVDSVTAALAARDLEVMVVVHPIIQVKRDAKGTLTEILPVDAPAGDDVTTESVIHIEITEQSDPEVLSGVETELQMVLAEVRAAVEDWKPIHGRVDAAIQELSTMPQDVAVEDTTEVQDFLTWLLDNHFTFLGYRNYAFCNGNNGGALQVKVEGESYGILRDPDVLVFDELQHKQDLAPEVCRFLSQPTFLLITKANQRARVHRPVHMDVIGVKRFDADGNLAGIHLLVGLFTSNVYTNSPSFVPVLRRKLERVMKRAGFRPFSHDGKRLLNILENLPRDELFQASDDKLLEMALGILHLQERQHTALFLRQDEFERFISCIVFVPRDRYDTRLRLNVQRILEQAFNGVQAAYYTQVADSPLARLHFIIKTTAGQLPAYDEDAIQARIAKAARAWSDLLSEAILQAKGEEEGSRLARRYVGAFPSFYAESYTPQVAVFDIDRMEEAIRRTDTGNICGGIAMNLYQPLEAPEGTVNFKVYRPDHPAQLSEILPMLENMGFHVVGEVPFEVRLQDNGGNNRTVWLHDFRVKAREGIAVNVAEVREAFHDAFAKVWAGEAENDGFNRLVISVGLNWREVVILRAYQRYLRQAAFTFSRTSIENALNAHPRTTSLLVRLFHARFDPDSREDEGKVLERILAELDKVQSPDDDRILRRYLNLIQATLRTNFYQTTEDGAPKPYLSFKIDSRSVEDLPLPRPMVEVWVYSPRVEAVHLRGGKVARGGIRWSDRREDFRTEVLGLMKAQIVKNAVIVPVGSKGGFVVKTPPAEGGREALQAEGIECYRTFMRGLLDITDNLDGGEVVPPPNVVRQDGDDPYLVVAADKGTATFSDIANAISSDEYKFWLGDAFASGGSQGYDHKAMGITARGAWEAVKRHFRELGHDTQTQDFTVVGVGDMSGDVFGNGMLLSRHIKLVAAFNHMHIFVDPDPDPEASWIERKRLFDTPRSQWSDYNPEILSEGGMVFERRAKRLTLTPQIKQLTGLTADTVTPNELIKALLKAKVDLLWFGGIGTYVRSEQESDAEAGDRANDAIRVTARDLRCKVIGEGANLGVTQRGRIEFSLNGGRINTDAVDNSAGVDCSDHEVNIKILLNRIVADGELTMKQRNRLLEEMTDEVAELVLRNNYLQTQAISLMTSRAPELLDHQHRLMRMLEKAGRLDRAIEFLPDDEQISERLAARQGLTRPEISVVIAYSKIWLFDEILDSDLPDDPVMLNDLIGYFPKPLRERYADEIAEHKLRREIIATHTTNSMINRVGGTFVTQINEKTGMRPADIARAYIVTRDAFALRDLWSDVEALDTKVPSKVQLAMLGEANRLIERGTLWLLRHAPRPFDLAGLTRDISEGRAAMEACLNEVCPQEVHEDMTARAAAYIAEGVPEDLAMRVARLIVLASVPDVVRLAQDEGVDFQLAAAHYFAVGDRFGLGWLRMTAESLAHGGSHWEKLAASAVIDELYADQRALTARVLGDVEVQDTADATVEAWIDTCRPEVERADQLMSELRAAGSVDLAMLTVAGRQLGTMTGA